MAIGSAYGGAVSSGHVLKRTLVGIGAAALLAIVVLAAAAFALSGVTLAGDSTALARVSVQPLGGTVQRIQAFGPGGQRVPIALHGGRLTPLKQLTPGERVSVDVEVRRPGWLGWALGSQRTEHLTLRAPVAHVTERWMTVTAGSPVRVSFDRAVSAVAYGGLGSLTHHTLGRARNSISLGSRPATGAIEIAAAARPWERIGDPTQVSWFPPSSSPVMVSLPAAGTRIAPATALYLTFSRPVSDVLGSARPRVTPSTPGRWREANSHTLVFTPSGFGAALGSTLHVQLPHAVAVTAGASGLRTTSQIEWTVPPGSTLRLQQLLAQAGYLPVDWQPAGADVARTPRAEVQAAVEPPAGSFGWRYPNTPHQLRALWTPGQASVITKGAVMKLENDQQPHRRRRRRSGRVAHAARLRDRRQAPERRLQLRVRAP